MKKILLLGRKHTIQKELASDIYEQLSLKLPSDYELVMVNYNELIFDIQANDVSIMIADTGEDIASYDFVYMMSWYSYIPTRREIAFSIAHYLNSCNTPFVNSEALHSRSSSKISQMMLLALKGISIPRTIFGLSKPKLLQYVASDDGLQSERLVVKDALASRGAANFLCDSVDELEGLPIGQRESQPFIIQPFIPNDRKDWRIVVMGGEPKLIIERGGTGEGHLNNTSQGGNATLRDLNFLPDDVLNEVREVSRLLHREVTGVDVMQNNISKDYLILEANALPQLASGSFVDEKMQALSDMIVSTITKGAV